MLLVMVIVLNGPNQCNYSVDTFTLHPQRKCYCWHYVIILCCPIYMYGGLYFVMWSYRLLHFVVQRRSSMQQLTQFIET